MGSVQIRPALARQARAAATLIAIIVIFLLAGGCTPAAGSKGTSLVRGSLVRVSLCGGVRQAHPRVVNVNCANNSIAARDLRWSDWGDQVATATGSAVVDLCAFEECYAGDYVTVPIVVITSKIIHCPGRAPAYSRLQYVFVGRSPFAGLPAGVGVPDGSNTPGGLGDQTVSLVC
jgi:hypothetical protein